MSRPPLLTAQDVAERLRVSTSTVARLWLAGKLLGANVGAGTSRALRFDPADVEAYLAKASRPPERVKRRKRAKAYAGVVYV